MIGPSTSPAQRAEKQIAAQFAGPDVLEGAIAWARDVLDDAGIDATRKPRAAARSLRAARPGLSRIAARYLIHRVRGGGPAQGEGRGALLRR